MQQPRFVHYWSIWPPLCGNHTFGRGDVVDQGGRRIRPQPSGPAMATPAYCGKGLLRRRAPQAVITIADRAAAASPNAASAAAAGLHAARAQALTVASRGAEARDAVQTVADITDRLPQDIRDDAASLWAWPEHRLRHTQSWVVYTGTQTRLRAKCSCIVRRASPNPATSARVYVWPPIFSTAFRPASTTASSTRSHARSWPPLWIDRTQVRIGEQIPLSRFGDTGCGKIRLEPAHVPR